MDSYLPCAGLMLGKHLRKQESMSEQTLGEKRVRASFNPSSDSKVDEIKKRTAELIDLVEGDKGLDPRLAALAQTEYENAAMWAVKLVTTVR